MRHSDIENQQFPIDRNQCISDQMATSRKLTGRELMHKWANPRHIMAPMVDMSELPWRLLCRQYGTQLCYTPMIHSGQFVAAMRCHFGEVPDSNAVHNEGSVSEKTYAYRAEYFDGRISEHDSPLVMQFCANDPAVFLKATQYANHLSRGQVSVMDLNLGCPQGIAKRGCYGAFLMENWSLIASLVETVHTQNPNVSITAKIRVFEDGEKTVEYAKMIVDAGAQILTIHGRTRDMKGVKTGLADWNLIRLVRQSIPASVPVFANGNVLYFRDVERCLEETGCDGVMVAESNLHNPALFWPSAIDQVGVNETYTRLARESKHELLAQRYLQFEKYPLMKEHPPSLILAQHYIQCCIESKYGFPFSTSIEEVKAHRLSSIFIAGIRGHLFKLLRCVFTRFPVYRMIMGKTHSYNDLSRVLDEMRTCVEEVLMKNYENAVEYEWDLLTSAGAKEDERTEDGVLVEGGFRILPFWVCQPYVRAPVDENHQKSMTENSPNAETERAISDYRQQEKQARQDRKEARLARKKNPSPQANKKPITCGGCGTAASVQCISARCQKCCRDLFMERIDGYIAEELGQDVRNLQVGTKSELVPVQVVREWICLKHAVLKWKRRVDETA